MKKGRGFDEIFKRDESGLTKKEEAKASSVAASISVKVENNYPEEEISEAEEKALRKYSAKKALRGIWDRIRVLFFIARNPGLWGRAIAVPAAVAVLYLVLPVDAVPDVIPGAGLLDDIFVITGMIGLIVKSASSIPKEKFLEIRTKCPVDILPAFDSMFSVDTSIVEKEEECVVTAVDEREAQVEKTARDIKERAKGVKTFISSFHSALDEASRNYPSLKNTKLYRAVNWLDVHTDAVVTESKKIAMRTLEDVLKLMLLKKSVRSLLSFAAFALSLFFFSLKDDGIFFLVLSSLSMLLSYAFFIHSVIKNVPRIYHFLKVYFRDGLEAAVVALLFKDAGTNPGLKGALVKCGVRRIKNSRNIQTVILKNFGKTVIAFILKIALVAVSVYALKKVVLLTSGLTSSFQILFAPLVELFALFKSLK